MSQTLMKLIPAKVGAVPNSANESTVINRLKQAKINYESMRIVETKMIQFIDCGKNLEYVRCPHCYRDALRWWGKAMSRSEATGFTYRDVVMPCCQQSVKLEDLEYCLPSGFARYVIELRGADDLTNTELFAFSTLMGMAFIKVNARY